MHQHADLLPPPNGLRLLPFLAPSDPVLASSAGAVGRGDGDAGSEALASLRHRPDRKMEIIHPNRSELYQWYQHHEVNETENVDSVCCSLDLSRTPRYLGFPKDHGD